MKKLLRILFALSLVCVPVVDAGADSRDDAAKQYIRKWSSTAVSEMYRSGVPASITLAQGLLESGNGLSALAVQGNNHFGIKCHDWKGAKIYFDDDRKGECFRKYARAEDSFRDHSDFLRYRDRYKFLFDLKTTDYKGWAYGLKKAGYATDPKYPQKLIDLIEKYGLTSFDKAPKTGKTQPIPETPAELETPVPLDRTAAEKFSYPLSRRLYSQNKVPFVYAAEGETYRSIAKYYNLFYAEILKFNDLYEGEDLVPGEIVYLQRKHSKAARKVNKYVAEGGETLWEIAQRFGVRMSALMKKNHIEADYVARPEDTLKLR